MDTMPVKTHLSQLFKNRKSTLIGSDHRNNDSDVDMYSESLNDDDPVSEGNGEDEEDEEDEKGEEDNNEEGENTGKEEDNNVSEEEDVDVDADKRYWEAKAKEGVRRVSLVISEAVNNINKLQNKTKT